MPKGLLMLLTLARMIAAALLITSAAAFAIAATIEHHTASSEHTAAVHRAAAETPGEHPASGEPAAGHESPATHAAERNSEDLLGINPESTGAVVTAVLVSLLAAALILTVGSPLLAAGVALAMLAFTALDIREVIHQLNESRPGLAALAAAIAALHLLAGATAIFTTRRTRPSGLSTP
jgi:hypothetical protein